MMKQGFVDIHTHILPGIDDGSRDWAQTERMLQLQSEQGVTDIIATPHFDTEQNDQNPQKLRELVMEANEHAKNKGIEITIHTGCEVLYTPGVLEAYRKGDILTLADSQYLLLEFFPRSSYQEISEAVSSFSMEGVTPVLAHVERYECLMNQYDRLYEMMKKGAVMQMNSRSLLGKRFDKRVRMCRKMVENGFIHFLGSDCHNEEERPPKMQEPHDVIAKLYGEKSADNLTENNARYILEKKFL